MLKSDGTTQNYLYLHRDYQGSILAITNASGTVIEKRIYDAWGSLIKYWNNSGITTVPTTEGVMLLDRGYTGHEMLLGVGLINMNARLYDPKLHRFLAPDNYVQAPENTQSFNRYGYCMNNPLKYADWTGENWWDNNWKQVVVVTAVVVVAVVVTVATAGMASPIAAAMITSGAAGFTGATLGTALNGGGLGDSLLAGIKGGIMGTVMGGIGAYASALAGVEGIIPGVLFGAGSSATLGAFSNLITGNDWNAGLGFNLVVGGIGGGYSGYAAASASGSGVWFGTAAKPSASVIASNVNNSIEEAQIAYDKATQVQTESTTIENTTSELTFYRGGNNTELSAADIRSGLDKGTGLMQPGKGLSLNTDKFNKFIDEYGGAFEVDLKSIPKELNLVNTSLGGTHFVISPLQPITPSAFQSYLNQVKLKPFNVISK